jgi:anti-anti-sigma factor
MSSAGLRLNAPSTIGVANRQALRSYLLRRLEEGARDIIVGLEKTSYIDSTGLALLASLHRAIVREKGGRLRISGANPELLRLFDLTCLSGVLELVESDAARIEAGQDTVVDWEADVEAPRLGDPATGS